MCFLDSNFLKVDESRFVCVKHKLAAISTLWVTANGRLKKIVVKLKAKDFKIIVNRLSKHEAICVPKFKFLGFFLLCKLCVKGWDLTHLYNESLCHALANILMLLTS